MGGPHISTGHRWWSTRSCRGNAGRGRLGDVLTAYRVSRGLATWSLEMSAGLICGRRH